MNAIDLLKEDHDVVDELFKRVEDTPPSKHPPIFKKIKNELDTHAHIEEKVFYPALKAKGNKELVDITSEGLEEHAQIKKFLKEIARSTSADKREAKLKVLIEDTRHHVKEEENEMFPMVKDQFSSEELEKLGERLEAEKMKFQKAKKIPARREEPQQGAVASMFEKAKEFVATAFAGGTETSQQSGGRSSAGKSSARAGAAKKSSGGAKRTSASGSKAKASGSNGKQSGSSAKSSSSGSKTSSGSSKSRSSSAKKASSGGGSKSASSSSKSSNGRAKSSSSSKSSSSNGGAKTSSAKRTSSANGGSKSGSAKKASGGSSSRKSTSGSGSSARSGSGRGSSASRSKG